MDWIAVKDRGPKPRKDVLGYDEFYGTIGVVYWDGKSYADDGEPFLRFRGGTDDCYITHWMPLPLAPPRVKKPM
jgi:hypothetical protein